jgi:hypothetical protein
MNSFLHLVAFTTLEEASARARLDHEPDAAAVAYRDIMRKIPNLHAFFNRIRDSYRNYPADGAKVIDDLWFRIWVSIESDSAFGSTETLDLLAKVPHPDDRVIDISPQHDPNPLGHCLRKLQALVSH